ncbi:MAG: hypothetical protein EOO62_21380 [Hymenobacter sp.]|nr:MAG: hypothetical protein EOO62_21380 [Hymenobacter sp.]
MTAPSTHRLRAALGLAGLLAAAPATGPWTLQRAIDYGLAHNLGVRLNQLTAQNNAQVLRQSKAALLPTANLSGTQAWQYGTSVNPLTFEFQNQTVRANNFSGITQLVIFQGFQLQTPLSAMPSTTRPACRTLRRRATT